MTVPVRSARDLVPAGLWDKQVGLLMRDYPYDSVMAARVLGQGYAYLLTAMNHRGQSLGLAPSKLVDIGVHTVILDTVAYAELCEKYNAGQFLHHVPKVDMKNDGSVLKAAHIVAVDGWEVVLPLWTDADCGPCHPGNDSH
ncbi:glycine-rich domain-containing protein [Streptomyces cinerochromogenes]|uniref:glycine-rich domain-containing protein n=1 Tax=Streptomyces cinerochromogenes TaxID=66422 RepID=UPI00167149B2